MNCNYIKVFKFLVHCAGLFLFSLYFSQQAFAEIEFGKVCEQPQAVATYLNYQNSFSDVEMVYTEFQPPTCKAVEDFIDVLKVSSIATSLTGIAAACTGVGAPFTVMTQVTALGLRFLAIKAKRLPCREADNLNTLEHRLRVDNRFREIFKLELKYEICEELEAAGVSCNPPMIEFELKNNNSYI